MARTVSISLIVPIYEQDDDVVCAINNMILKLRDLLLKGTIADYELLVFLSATRYFSFPASLVCNKNIRFVDNEENSQIGSMFQKGIKLAGHECVGLIPPYNQIDLDMLDDIFKAIKNHDMVAAYIGNPSVRPWYRALASAVNTSLVNWLFGLKIKYYHECFYLSSLVKKVQFTTHSHAAMTEAAVWLTKSGVNLAQIPFRMIPHNFKSKSRAFRVRNIINILKTYICLFWQIRILGKRISLE